MSSVEVKSCLKMQAVGHGKMGGSLKSFAPHVWETMKTAWVPMVALILQKIINFLFFGLFPQRQADGMR